MQTAQAYYAKPENRKRALESASGQSCIAGSWGYTRRLALRDGGGVWELNARGERTGAYFCDKFPDGWRELARPKFSSMREEICGWYADSFQNETIEPHVLQLPSRGGEVHYVPATSRTDCDGVTLYLGDVIRGEPGGLEGASDENCAANRQALRDAWRRANRCAEIEAERAREDDAKFQAEAECERLAEESGKLLAQILGDVRALAAFPFAEERSAYPSHARAAGALEERIATARGERSANFARRRELRACPWLIVEGN